jgi:hypothetical protein
LPGAGAAGRGEGGERGWRLGEIVSGCGEDAVVVDAGDVGVSAKGRQRGGARLCVEEIWREQGESGVRAEASAGQAHGGKGAFGGRVTRLR